MVTLLVCFGFLLVGQSGARETKVKLNPSRFGVKDLAGLQELSNFSFSGPSVTVQGLKEIAKLEKLTYLDLMFAPVTDKELKDLARLEKLSLLNVMSTKVTAEGAKKLQKALPKCKILTFH